MTTTVLERTTQVATTVLADGVLVRLVGDLDGDALPRLRDVLLREFPEAVRDIVVDAGEVEDISDTAVAVLLAGREWAELTGRRLLLSRSSFALDRALVATGLLDELPRLAAPAQRPAQRPAQGSATVIPLPRTASS